MTGDITTSKIHNVGLSGIACLPQRRAVRSEVVDALAQSMRDVGLINPITLRPREGLGFYLIAGRHRCEAARKLKWEGIAAIVLEGLDAVEAELREIDENLIRADLSPAEQAAHTARRKELYEKKYPETKRGAAGRGRKKSQIATSNEPAPAFIDDAAQKTGKDRSTVARAIKRGKDIPAVADLAGTSLDKGDELDALAELGSTDPGLQGELIKKAKRGEKVSAKIAVKKARRAARERELGETQLALPQKKYGVILADPEWEFEPWSRETGMDRSPSNHYPTSNLETIASRGIPLIAADDCVLFLWATVPMLPEALQVLKAWGFEYRSNFTWRKDRIGTGYWQRNKHEHLLVGVKGHVPAPAMGTQWESLLDGAVRGHSVKPDWQYELIEAYFPTLPKIELNARRSRPGWDAWGFEAPGQHLQHPQVSAVNPAGGRRRA